MFELHLSLSQHPSNISNNDYADQYSKLFINLEPKLILKNLQDNSLQMISNTDPYGYFFDFYSLMLGASIFKENLYNQRQTSDNYIISCSCGIPECMGIYDGVHIKSSQKFISWRTHQDDGYKPSSPLHKYYLFDKQQYINVLRSVKEQIIQLELNEPDLYRISGVSIPLFFSRLARTSLYLFYQKQKNKVKHLNFLVDDSFNNFRTKSMKNIDRNSYFFHFHKHFYDTITNGKLPYPSNSYI